MKKWIKCVVMALALIMALISCAAPATGKNSTSSGTVFSPMKPTDKQIEEKLRIYYYDNGAFELTDDYSVFENQFIEYPDERVTVYLLHNDADGFALKEDDTQPLKSFLADYGLEDLFTLVTDLNYRFLNNESYATAESTRMAEINFINYEAFRENYDTIFSMIADKRICEIRFSPYYGSQVFQTMDDTPEE